MRESENSRESQWGQKVSYFENISNLDKALAILIPFMDHNSVVVNGLA